MNTTDFRVEDEDSQYPCLPKPAYSSSVAKKNIQSPPPRRAYSKITAGAQPYLRFTKLVKEEERPSDSEATKEISESVEMNYAKITDHKRISIPANKETLILENLTLELESIETLMEFIEKSAEPFFNVDRPLIPWEVRLADNVIAMIAYLDGIKLFQIIGIDEYGKYKKQCGIALKKYGYKTFRQVLLTNYSFDTVDA